LLSILPVSAKPRFAEFFDIGLVFWIVIWLKVAGMGKIESGRGARRAPKPAGHSIFTDLRKSKLVMIPIVILILSLIAAPAASNWIPEGNESIPLITSGPTLMVTEPVLPSQAPTIAPIPSLTFASFNITKANSTAVPSWAKRRDAIGRTINESNSDVIGVQEATDITVTGEGGKRMTQWRDVQAIAVSGGYVGTNVEVDTCQSSNCIHSAHILFKSEKIKQIDLPNDLPSAGQGRLSDIVAGLSYAKNREFGWAYLEGLNGTGTFLAISIHLNNEKNARGKKDRELVGKAITKWAEDLNVANGMADIPIVLLGDFNSYDGREPKGMLFELAESGWLDAFEAPTNEYKFFGDAYTASYTKNNRSGWPKRPITSSDPVRIDYVMYKSDRLHADAYQVALRLKEDGTFDNDYRGSDHMMVQAIIRFDPLPKP
jgi:endonuclease/exonuclease/phosphatase family metal-dependent hydrolase